MNAPADAQQPARKHTTRVDPQAFVDFDTIIDVRSPAEYALDHVPGAINAPVLSDTERAEVGTLYKQVSPFAARKLGAALVSKNIAHHLQDLFVDRPRTWRPLVYCWRGGQRSGSMAHVLREVGWDAHSISGGYKAWRRYVIESLDKLPLTLRFQVIHGPTGSGKSRLLRALRLQHAQVLDLEALAAHRGSVLGEEPGAAQPSQKMFESMLWDTLRQFNPARVVFVEGESKKIGQLQVPDMLMECMRRAACLRIDAHRETRIQLLCEEYAHFFQEPAQLADRLQHLHALHGSTQIAEWHQLIHLRDWSTLVGSLLDHHYDAAYHRSSHHNYAQLNQAPTIQITQATEAAFLSAASQLSVAFNSP